MNLNRNQHRSSDGELKSLSAFHFAEGPSDVLDHATSEIASGSKLGIDATKKLPGEGFKRPWPPLIKMDAAAKAKVEQLFNP
jgi:4-hydroxy-3-polyprenylbenzoate decarboxylase